MTRFPRDPFFLDSSDTSRSHPRHSHDGARPEPKGAPHVHSGASPSSPHAPWQDAIASPLPLSASHVNAPAASTGPSHDGAPVPDDISHLMDSIRQLIYPLSSSAGTPSFSETPSESSAQANVGPQPLSHQPHQDASAAQFPHHGAARKGGPATSGKGHTASIQYTYSQDKSSAPAKHEKPKGHTPVPKSQRPQRHSKAGTTDAVSAHAHRHKPSSHPHSQQDTRPSHSTSTHSESLPPTPQDRPPHCATLPSSSAIHSAHRPAGTPHPSVSPPLRSSSTLSAQTSESSSFQKIPIAPAVHGLKVASEEGPASQSTRFPDASALSSFTHEVNSMSVHDSLSRSSSTTRPVSPYDLRDTAIVDLRRPLDPIPMEQTRALTTNPDASPQPIEPPRPSHTATENKFSMLASAPPVTPFVARAMARSALQEGVQASSQPQESFAPPTPDVSFPPDPKIASHQEICPQAYQDGIQAMDTFLQTLRAHDASTWPETQDPAAIPAHALEALLAHLVRQPMQAFLRAHQKELMAALHEDIQRWMVQSQDTWHDHVSHHLWSWVQPHVDAILVQWMNRHLPTLLKERIDHHLQRLQDQTLRSARP